MPRKKKQPVKTNVKVPSQVAKAAKEADELQAQLANPEGDDPANNEPKDGDDPVDNTPEPKDTDPPISKQVVDPDNEPAEPEGVDPDLFNTPEPTEPSDEDWEGKYKALQGKFDAEITRYKTALQANEQMSEALQKRIEALEASAPAAPVISPGPDGDIPVLDVEKFDGYGPEMQEMVKAMNLMKQRLAEAYGVINALKSQGPDNPTVDRLTQDMEMLKAQTAYSAQQRYEDYLNKHVVDRNGNPIWQKINMDQRFREWLKTDDPMTGINRGAILKRHNDKMDGPRVVVFYRNFIDSITASKAKPGSNPKLESQVVPETAGAGDPNPSKPKDTVTLAEFNEATKLVTQGRMTEEEYNKVAAKFHKAIAKGEVVGVPIAGAS